ncbi:MAG TPA: hypothetical protein VGT01_05660 [Candidatus Dormibacteraeota bacterium]|nr:hypothetical protein [Candidatus Dormibacteraeota bacterium]HEV2476646.1 hypothetical protein [Candidatus Dormibacteraeota bacterium]
MQPVYVRKANPTDRVTWMDWFIAQEPKGGVRDVVEMVRRGQAKVVFAAIMGLDSKAAKVAA